MLPDRCVQIDCTVKEARAIAAALEIAGEVMRCCEQPEIRAEDLDELAQRFTVGIAISDLEKMLGRHGGTTA